MATLARHVPNQRAPDLVSRVHYAPWPYARWAAVCPDLLPKTIRPIPGEWGCLTTDPLLLFPYSPPANSSVPLAYGE